MGKLKIFLSYHKKTPIYKSDIFEPIHAGSALVPDRFCETLDCIGDNISELNPYYCELTGYYYVLKNYLDSCQEEYIGFAHYRRLIDLTKISDISTPAIFGLNYSNSVKVFNSFNNYDLAKLCEPYDIILPCKVYMYKETVNPILRENEPALNMYEHFKIEHKNDLIDTLKSVIAEDFPEYLNAAEECFGENFAHFYNIYVMKKPVLKEFLDWEFRILFSMDKKLNGWMQKQYERMAGFIGERLINIWLKANVQRNFKIGYAPVYMIDFESEYIRSISEFDHIGRYDLELNELKKLFEITSDKVNTSRAIFELYTKQNNHEQGKKQLSVCMELAKTARDYDNIAKSCLKYGDLYSAEIEYCYTKSLELDPGTKLYAQKLLSLCKNLHNIDKTYQAWQKMLNFELTAEEKQQYKSFMKCFELIIEDAENF